MTWNKGKGRGLQWLKERVTYTGDDCLIWPMFRDPEGGYGRIGYKGRIRYAHRVMCEFAHGEPPTPEHHAAHLCGKGHEGCVNPRHLEWKTPADNSLDRRTHGTHVTSQWGNRGKLTPTEVAEIRAMIGRMPRRKIAERFNVSRNTVYQIATGKTHKQAAPAA